jgi:hypothetical protein
MAPATRIISLLMLCSPLAAQIGWSTPVLETALNSSSTDTGPHLSIDGLTVHFASFRSGNYEIYSATRAGVGAPWSAPVLETALSDGTAQDDQPFLSADGQSLWFASTRGGTYDIWVATRSGTGWNAPTVVSELSSPTASAESAPSLTADGLEIYFLTAGWSAPATPQNAIHRATRTSTALPFGTPTLVTEFANANTHRDVEVAPDGLSIIYTEFVSPRLQVMMAERASRSLPFSAPVVLTEFSGVGPSLGVYGFTRSLVANEAIIAAGHSAAAGGQEFMNTRFTGLTHYGVAGIGSQMGLQWRDPASPGKVYALAAAFGNTGFTLGARFVPLDADFLLEATFGADRPPFSAGWVGVLDAGGEGGGTLTNAIPALTGLTIYCGAFTLDLASPFGVATIGNSFAVQLH